MKYYLIKQSACWADEFDTEGFCIKEANNKQEVLENLIHSKHKFPVERSFGTNESHTWETKEEYLETLEIEEIDINSYLVLKTLFGEEYGMFISLEDY